MALIARFMFSRAAFSSGSATATDAAGSGSGSGESKLPWMLGAGSFDVGVELVEADLVPVRFDPTLGSIAVLGVVVMVAEGGSFLFRDGGGDVADAAALLPPDLVSVRFGAFFSRKPSINSIPIQRKM